MSTFTQHDQSVIEQWLLTKASNSSIEQQLQESGMPVELADEYRRAYQKRLVARRQVKGFKAMAIGAFLGFASCVLTLINPIPALYDVILYGLTSVAIVIIFWGMYLVFEN